MIVRVEHGRLGRVPLDTLRAIAAALEADLDVVVRWRGGDLGRLINARHAAMHEILAARLGSAIGWLWEPEVSYSVFGERGVIDALAWHAATRSLLVVELKTEIVDINDLMASMDRRRRLATGVARERGWDPGSVSMWVVVADGRTNRRALRRHEAALRAKFPDDGRRARAWLTKPVGSLRALGFLPIEALASNGAVVSGRRRVRHSGGAAPTGR